MKILITGISGMLGTDLVASLSHNHDLFGICRRDFQSEDVKVISHDLCDGEGFVRQCEQIRPDIVFHCAAMTQVDQCEEDRERAFNLNAGVTQNVVEACKRVGAFLIHFSTDYVFDGSKEGEYLETDETNPVSVYGESKLAAEKVVLDGLDDYAIFRLTWLYGENGSCFPKAILKHAAKRDSLDVVDDQVGRPTYTHDLAVYFGELLNRWDEVKTLMKGQIFHLGNTGYCSWADFAIEILSLSPYKEVKVRRITSEELDRPAPRPKNSILSLEKMAQLKVSIRSWQEAIKDYMRKTDQ